MDGYISHLVDENAKLQSEASQDISAAIIGVQKLKSAVGEDAVIEDDESSGDADSEQEDSTNSNQVIGVRNKS